MDDKEIVKRLINSNLFLTLATSSNNIPWICPLFFASDNQYNLYFTSYNDSQHVKNIHGNPKVAVSIYNSLAIPGKGNTQGVQISGICHRVTGDNLKAAIEVVYNKRFPDPKERESRDLSVEHFSLPDSYGRTDHIYKIETDKFYILDKKTGKDTRIEVQIK